MKLIDRIPRRSRVAFGLAFLLCLVAGAAFGALQPADASVSLAPLAQGGDDYAGPERCGVCHEGKKTKTDKKPRNAYGKALQEALGKKMVKNKEKDLILESFAKTEKVKSGIEDKTFGDLLKEEKLPAPAKADEAK